MSTETNTNISTTPEPETPQADPAATAARETATEPTPVATAPVTLQSIANANQLHQLRRKHAGKLPYMAHVPAHHFETPNFIVRRKMNRSTTWKNPYGHDEFCTQSRSSTLFTVTLVSADDKPFNHPYGRGEDARAAYHAAWREMRLSRYDKAALLRGNARLHADLDLMADTASDLDCQVIKLQMGPAQWQKDVQALKEQVQLEKATADALREENARLVSQLTKYQLAAQAAHKVRVSTVVTLPATAPEDK